MGATFGQHSKLLARPGKKDQLVAKFLEAAEIQRSNPACVLMFVSRSPDEPDAVFLTEIWTSAEDHRQARESDVIAAWAQGMPDLVAGPPDTQRLLPAGGTGL